MLTADEGGFRANPLTNDKDDGFKVMGPRTSDVGEKRSSAASAARVAAACLCVVPLAAPWAFALAVEEATRRASGGSDSFMVRGAGWSFVTMIYDDAIALAARSDFLETLLWRFPEHHAVDESGTKLAALTIDDAPGDNPEAFGALLDVLRDLAIKVTFFCTTELITPTMAPLLERAVREGHEVRAPSVTP